jgi:hypothetical protein
MILTIYPGFAFALTNPATAGDVPSDQMNS